jgi:Protein of unknown function (DUF3485)
MNTAMNTEGDAGGRDAGGTAKGFGLSRRDLALGLAGFCLLLSAAAGGELLERGLNDPVALQAACDRLQRIPAEFGSWVSVDRPITEREQRMAQIAGYVRREYRHQESGYVVTMTLLCGPAGPMSVHPPTTCFSGMGYSLASGPHPTQFQAGDAPLMLNKASFRAPTGVAAEVARVFWGWSTEGVWQSPQNPRLQFRGLPVLYKLYVVDYGIGGPTELAQAETFLQEALPVIREALQP